MYGYKFLTAHRGIYVEGIQCPSNPEVVQGAAFFFNGEYFTPAGSRNVVCDGWDTDRREARYKAKSAYNLELEWRETLEENHPLAV